MKVLREKSGWVEVRCLQRADAKVELNCVFSKAETKGLSSYLFFLIAACDCGGFGD